MTKRCLFLGYNNKQTKLINFLRKKKFKVRHTNKKLINKNLNNFDLIISFGYRHLIDKKIIFKLNRPILNLHMSYLPYNRGAHPNFWSLMENTPSGVTIHEIDASIDSGAIIIQKKLKFNLNLDSHNTFKKTYNILKKEIEKLFINNFDILEKKTYNFKKQKSKNSTFRKKNELPKFMKNWNMNIKECKKLFKV